MNTPSIVAEKNGGASLQRKVLGHSFRVWHRLQSGQESVIRFSQFAAKHGNRLRHQNGHEHSCSVNFLCAESLIQIRPYVELDELLITRCFQIHDTPEGFLKRDVITPLKRDSDDVKEYESFAEWYMPLGKQVWKEMQKCFLLQFVISTPVGLPKDAYEVIGELGRQHRYDALFFDGVQRLDYLYYAYECHQEYGITDVLEGVVSRQMGPLNLIACQLPGFEEVLWTAERREFFASFDPM